MNINPGKLEFSEPEHLALQVQVKTLMASEQVSQADIGRQADIPDSSLSQYLGGKYPNEKGKADIAAKLTRWMRSREEAKQLRRRLPVAPSFISLQGSEQIGDALAYARETGRMVLVTGMPGVSKTATSLQFAADTPRTWYAAMDPSTSGVPTMLLEILAAMGVSEAKGTPQVLMRLICQHASHAKGLIIIDEGQHLSPKAIEALRSINDRTRKTLAPVGIAILGNEEAYSTVGPTGGKASFAQVSSRFAHREWIAAPNPGDAMRFAQAWADANGEAVTKVELAYCQEIATKPGGLRNIEMTMENAILSARGSDQPLTIAHLRSAFAHLSGMARGR